MIDDSSDSYSWDYPVDLISTFAGPPQNSTEKLFVEAPVAEHTPGPWKVEPYVDAIDILAPDGSAVAHMADRDLSSNGMPPANARLIAAAPDLLAACEEALRIARIVRPSSQAVALDKAESVFRDAISKAKGTPLS